MWLLIGYISIVGLISAEVLEGNDVSISDILVCAVSGLLGPITTLLVLVELKNKGYLDKVVIKGQKKEKE
jgi:hypothetical protein